MRHAFFALVVGLVVFQCSAVSAQQPAVEQRPAGGCDCQHRFGNDWRPGPNPDVSRAAVKVIDFCEAWKDVPDRIERAVSWATFGTGVLAGGVVFLALLTVGQVVLGRRPE